MLAWQQYFHAVYEHEHDNTDCIFCGHISAESSWCFKLGGPWGQKGDLWYWNTYFIWKMRDTIDHRSLKHFSTLPKERSFLPLYFWDFCQFLYFTCCSHLWTVDLFSSHLPSYLTSLSPSLLPLKDVLPLGKCLTSKLCVWLREVWFLAPLGQHRPVQYSSDTKLAHSSAWSWQRNVPSLSSSFYVHIKSIHDQIKNCAAVSIAAKLLRTESPEYRERDLCGLNTLWTNLFVKTHV